MVDDSSALCTRQARAMDDLDDVIKASFAQVIGYLEQAGKILQALKRRCTQSAASEKDVAECRKSIARLERLIDIVQQHALPELLKQMALVKELRASHVTFLKATGSIKSGT